MRVVDAAADQVENGLGLKPGDARVGKGLELVGMQMQRLADQEGRFRDGIGGAVRELELGLDEAAHGIADEIEQGKQFGGQFFRFQRDHLIGALFAAPNFRTACFGLFRGRLDALCHQLLVQRAAAASSWARASIQFDSLAPSSCFQNGAEVFR